MPGTLPAINRAHRIPVLSIFTEIPQQTPVPPDQIPAPPPTSTNNVATLCCSHHLNDPTLPCFHNIRFISQEAVNSLITNDLSNSSPAFTPLKLHPQYTPTPNLEHYAHAMEHPITGKHITSYQKLMQDPATLDVWMHALGKDFGCMTQGDIKTGTTRTNSIFVMEPRDVLNIPKDQPPTYAKVVVAYCPQKEDPYRVRITAGGNLLNYPRELTTCTADMTTAKLHWNSVLSTSKVQYMCLDIGNFYLRATLDRYEYMKMPINLFPQWIINQYDLNSKVIGGYIYLQMCKAV
jgi:hypothetical protein